LSVGEEFVEFAERPLVERRLRFAGTLDHYGHLLPGSEDEAAGLVDAFLVRANTHARIAQVAAA